jgi:hypothetical protein
VADQVGRVAVINVGLSGYSRSFVGEIAGIAAMIGHPRASLPLSD